LARRSIAGWIKFPTREICKNKSSSGYQKNPGLDRGGNGGVGWDFLSYLGPLPFLSESIVAITGPADLTDSPFAGLVSAYAPVPNAETARMTSANRGFLIMSSLRYASVPASQAQVAFF
jgi:hypothetical protein